MEEIQETQETPTPAPAPRKSALPYLIGIGVVVLLAAAAFVAVKYFVQPQNAEFGDSGGPMISMQGPGGANSRKSFRLNVKPAQELPVTKPVEGGLFVERKDSSIFIGTGNVTVMAKAKPGEQPKVDSSFSGPKVEVVISANTVIYKDTTKFDEQNPGAEVQQTVELSTIDDITQQSSLTVWGRKAGDRIIADVIVFSSPFMVKGQPGKP